MRYQETRRRRTDHQIALTLHYSADAPNCYFNHYIPVCRFSTGYHYIDDAKNLKTNHLKADNS
jgi:hypothetical protein